MASLIICNSFQFLLFRYTQMTESGTSVICDCFKLTVDIQFSRLTNRFFFLLLLSMALVSLPHLNIGFLICRKHRGYEHCSKRWPDDTVSLSDWRRSSGINSRACYTTLQAGCKPGRSESLRWWNHFHWKPNDNALLWCEWCACRWVICLCPFWRFQLSKRGDKCTIILWVFLELKIKLLQVVCVVNLLPNFNNVMLHLDNFLSFRLIFIKDN